MSRRFACALSATRLAPTRPCPVEVPKTCNSACAGARLAKRVKAPLSPRPHPAGCALRTAVADEPATAHLALLEKLRLVEVFGRNLEAQGVGEMPGDGPALVIHTGLPRLLALQALAAQVVGVAVLHEDAARLDEGERHTRALALALQRADPIKVARPTAVVVLAPADHLLDAVLAQASGCGFLERGAADERRVHDAAMLCRRGEQEGDALVSATLVLAGHVEHDVLPAISPVGRQATGEAFRPFGEDEEPHVGTGTDDVPGLGAPRVRLGEQEVRGHADADELAGAYLGRAVARAPQGIVEVLRAGDARRVDAAPFVVVEHVAVIAALACAPTAVPGVPDIVHDGCLDHDAVAVVGLVLDDLRRVPTKGFKALAKVLVEIADHNAPVPRGGARAGKRQAALVGLVFAGACRDARIVHEPRARAVLYDDDALELTDHVRRHADAFVRVRGQCVEQVLPDGRIGGRGLGGWHAGQDG